MNPLHIPPSFYIIGERKCGTSSLYRYLVHHPNVLPCALKEPNFFGRGKSYVKKNIASYWELFPLKKDAKPVAFSWPELNEQGILYHEDIVIPRVQGRKYITGEASANTFYEVAPTLVHQYLPDCKLIVLLRNPVSRAFSHYRMYKRFQEEGRPLDFLVRDFETEVREEIDLIAAGTSGEYLAPSIYIHQIKNWLSTFNKDQIRIYFTEDLQEPTQAKVILEDVQQFLDLPQYDYGMYLQRQFNKAPVATMSDSLYHELSLFFAPYNKALFDLLQVPNRWD